MKTTAICFYLCLVLVGCDQDECVWGQTKCERNRLYLCVGNGLSHPSENTRWNEVFNCTDYNATCKKGETARFNPYRGSSTVDDYYSYGCSTTDMACDGDTDMHCFADNSLIVACSYSNEPTAMIVAEKESQHPLCVEQSNGLARFAYFPGECVSARESSCLNENQRILCENGVWSGLSVNCATLNQKCESTTDSEGYQVSQCVNAGP